MKWWCSCIQASKAVLAKELTLGFVVGIHLLSGSPAGRQAGTERGMHLSATWWTSLLQKPRWFCKLCTAVARGCMQNNPYIKNVVRAIRGHP